ncbi:MAG TPA: DUF559 domain-containing protein [Opitutaceae bacterium]|jgi:hypothetical protein|nr:DUF559 domain-containing protein [Opitutaceae bacterium]
MAFYIDLVVIGAGRRLAIECDGEQFHGPEQLQDDIARQAVLERLGWTFVRIRGSIFFRNEDRALEPVFRRLEELGIPPELKTGTTVSPDARNELIERVIREAEKLRATWRAESPDETPEPEIKSRWHANTDSRPSPPSGGTAVPSQTIPAESKFKDQLTLTPTKTVLLNLVGSSVPANGAAVTSKPTGRFEQEILSVLRTRGRSETEALILELARQFRLDDVGRRQLRAALDTLEAQGAIRRGANYVVLANTQL